jgi:hypothetical protein
MLPWLLRIWRLLPSPLRFVYLRLRYGHFGIGVAALIRDDTGRILLVHRTYSRDEPWALPGGWLECSMASPSEAPLLVPSPPAYSWAQSWWRLRSRP